MNKRRILAMILTICIITASVSMTFAAETGAVTDVIAKAQALNKLGMLAGDGKGNYSLESNLKRSEAATFIVKLMGKSKEVADKSSQYINTGFDDIKTTDWFSAYVGFCKENDVISGIGNNKFGPNSNVTEKAFLTMTMKALGYTSDDFNWNSVYQKAYDIGLVTGNDYNGKTQDNVNYTRAEVVNIMYTALTLKAKDSDNTLLKQLVNEGKLEPKVVADSGLSDDKLPVEISKVSVQSSQWIKIELNEHIKQLKDTDISVYENLKWTALSAKIISQTDKEIRIKTDAQKAGIEYVIKISNLLDEDNNYVKEIKSKFIGFENKAVKSDLFKISKIEQVSASDIAIYFTHPININAEQPDCYSILKSDETLIEGNKNNISVKVMDGKSDAVILRVKNFTFSQDVEYTVKIKGSLISSYGTYLGQESGDQMNFIAKSIASESFKLVGLVPLNTKSIQLDFNKPINKVTAEQVFSYYITELTIGTPVQIIKATTTSNTYGTDCAVVLTIAGNFDIKKAYGLMINSVSDATKQNKIEEQSYSFNPTDKAISDMKIASIAPIDLNSVSISFDRKLNPKTAEDITNYSVLCLNNTSYNISPVKAVYSSESPNTVKLYFSYNKPMTAGYMYKVRILNTLQDYTGTALTAPLEYTYIANNALKTKPEIIKAAFIAKDTIKITLNKDIALDVPNILTSNYYIQMIGDDNANKMPLAITYIDTNTIVLRFDKIDFSKQFYLKYNEIKDITGETYSGDQVNTAIVIGE